MTRKTIAAGQFKQGCLALLDEVADKDIEIVVTKRGRPVARLVPMGNAADRDEALLARLRGSMTGPVGLVADLLAPTSALTDWKLAPKARQR
ncbi:MAG TPA: type II toxin-antitoxin system prevent-host-death family antitoxin [Polyangia bacterium]